VAQTLATGIGYTRTGLIAVSELKRYNAPLWHDKLLSSTADSKLHPYDTGAEGLTRWTSTPMYLPNNTAVDRTPDGV
jgi:hypothetical protein